jgi:ligand-binding sensor domain-containing protein
MIVDSNGTLYFGTGNGVSTWDGKVWKSLIFEPGLYGLDVRALTLDKDKNLWIGLFDKGVKKYNGTTWTSYTTKEGLSSNEIMCMATDKAGTIWVGTLGEGLCVFDGNSWKKVTGPVDLYIETIEKAPNGDLWVGTRGGVSIYNGVTWKHITETGSLISNNITDIAFDNKGLPWITTNKGVSRQVILKLPTSIRQQSQEFVNSGSPVKMIINNHSGLLTVSVSLAQPQALSLTLYTLNGKMVRQISYAASHAGDHVIPFTNVCLSTGSYICAIKTGANTLLTKRFIVAR